MPVRNQSGVFPHAYFQFARTPTVNICSENQVSRERVEYYTLTGYVLQNPMSSGHDQTIKPQNRKDVSVTWGFTVKSAMTCLGKDVVIAERVSARDEEHLLRVVRCSEQRIY